jgi:diguanylate cyclase (GGDEF)-like protein
MMDDGPPGCTAIEKQDLRDIKDRARRAEGEGVTRTAQARSTARLLVVYAAIMLVPVVALGTVLAASYRVEARRRGLAEGASAAALVAQTSVEPVLEGHPLSDGLTASERAGLWQLARNGMQQRTVLRLRLRDLEGRVVFSDDGSGFGGPADDEAVEAAHGEPVTALTRLNSDSNDEGPRGVAAVEAYRAVYAGSPRQPVGVLEMYLPYTPIERDVNAGFRRLYLDLAAGLVMLYVSGLLISMLVSRGLRRQLVVNAFLAEHDTLTDLPNRTLFHRHVEAAVVAARAGRSTVAIGIMDLDRFKEVNDTLGHHNGDRVLCELAGRLRDHIGPRDVVARLGGDEFGIILFDAADAPGALDRLRSSVNDEVEVSGLPLSIDASIGYVVAPDDGTNVDELLQRADVAMYVAKVQHAGVVRYDADLDHYDAANLELIGELRHAIDDGQLVLHYQPQTTLADGTIEAVEALVRWQHPIHGLLYPDRFLPLAEQTDLIEKLTEWVLETALADSRALAAAGHDLCVAVNVSARNLVRIDFATRVGRLLDRLRVPAGRLVIEITETALLTDPARAAAILAELDARGVRVSIDDFGKGQTSLGSLSTLTVHELKIDKSFIFDMLVNDAHRAIVRSIVDLGHNLGLRVVGEGVETEAALIALRTTGCDLAQGYLMARPMPLAALDGWLAEMPRSRWREVLVAAGV